MSAPVQVGPSPQGDGPAPSPDWDELLADIGDRIRAERQARGWSQEHLAESASLSRHAVRNAEIGIGTLRTFLQVCWAMDVSLDHVLSDGWRLPERGPRLSVKQLRVLSEVASGDSLTRVGARMGLDSRLVAAHLTRIYQLLGVAHLVRGERRAAAVRVAMQHGLFNPQETRTS